MTESKGSFVPVSERLIRRGGVLSKPSKAFAVVGTALVLLVGLQALMYYRPTEPSGPETPSRVVNGPSGPSDSFPPSSQTVVNGTQAGGDCGSTWSDLNISDDSRCSYQEANKAPANQTGIALTPDGTDVNGWSVSSKPDPKCSTDAEPWNELDDGGDTDDGDATCRQGDTNGNRVGTTLTDPSLTDAPDVDDFTVVSSAVVKKIASQAASVSVDVKVGASAYNNGATQATTTSYVRYSRTDDVNPISGAEWTATDVNNLVVGTRCVDCAPNNRVTQIQAKVDAKYSPEYTLEVRFGWSGVLLVGDRWTLVAECQRLNPGAENVLIQVGQGGSPPTSWKTAYTCSSDSDATYDTYLLSAAELNGGDPVVRVWDAQVDTPDDTTRGTMALDVLRIDRTRYRTGLEPWFYYVEREVNVDSGNLFLEFRDLTVKALGWNLEIVRSYNSRLASADGLMGYGWTFTYDTRVVEQAAGLASWYGPDGSVNTFRLSGGSWIAPPGIDAKLTKPANFTLWFKDGSTFAFDAGGRLAKTTDRNGNFLSLVWVLAGSGYHLNQVRDQSGETLNFTYTGNLVRSVTDILGRQVMYGYDASGNLNAFTDAMGNATYFTYDGSHELLTWRDPVGRKATYRYDGSGRVDQIRHAAVVTATNATIYEYVSWGLDYAVNVPPGADHATNVTDARLKIAQIGLDASGIPVSIAGPQCRECLFVQQTCGGASTTFGTQGCGCSSGGCGQGGSVTELLNLTWDSNRNLVAKKDKGGYEYTYTYDSRRNLLNTTDPLGNVTRNVWTNVDNATTYLSTMNKTTNARGYMWWNEYDWKGNLKQMKDPTNNVSKQEFDSKGHVTKITDWRGHNTTFAYDIHGYVLNRTDATGNQTVYLNDGVGRVTRVTMPDLHYWQTVYDRNDRVTKTIDPLNNATTFTYNARNDRASVKDPLGRTTQYEWNITNLKRARLIDALGNSTVYGYDLVGNLVKITNARAFNTTFTYDNFNRRTVAKDALGNETQYTFDGDGFVISVRNRRGYRTNSTYDALHRTRTVIDAFGNTTTYDYDHVGNVIKVKNARDYNTTYTYDALGRLTLLTDATGNATRFAYDANGNLVNETDPNGNSNTFSYDAVNRRTVACNGEGEVTSLTYDSESNLVQVEDANLNVTAYTYDALNRRTIVTDANGNSTESDYDVVGNLLNVTDANNHKTTQEYDALNRLTESTTPLGKVTQYTYDANGNTRTRKDPNGNTTNYTFDALDRLVRIDYPGGSFLTAMYDAEGNTVAATGFGFTRTDSWDALDRVSSITFDYGNFSKTVSYTYDPVGNRKTMTYPEGQVVTYSWDGVNRLTTLQDSAVGSWTFQYDAGSRRTRLTHPSGLNTTYTHDKANRVTKLETKTSGGALVESFNYPYDDVGNRLSIIEESGNTTTYAYDNVYRLKSESYTGGLVINYSYDGVGNRLTEVRNAATTSYTYDADNRLMARGTTTYGYDDNGNTISKTVQGQGTTSYGYDFENRLTKVTLPNGTVEEFNHSVRGKRMALSVNEATTYLFYDFYDVSARVEDRIAEYNSSGSLLVRYVHGPGTDEPLAFTRGGVTYFYSANAIGTITTVTSTSQAVSADYEYEAFGSSRWAGSLANPYRFTGREWDGVDGLYYYRARWYDTLSGRFQVSDPWKFVDGPNLYAYVVNNPVSFVDPKGLTIGGDCRIPCFNGGGGGGGDGGGGGRRQFQEIIQPCAPYEAADAAAAAVARANRIWGPLSCAVGAYLFAARSLDDENTGFNVHNDNDAFAHGWISCVLVRACGFPGDVTFLLGILVEIQQNFANTLPDLLADAAGIYCALMSSLSCCQCMARLWNEPPFIFEGEP